MAHEADELLKASQALFRHADKHRAAGQRWRGRLWDLVAGKVRQVALQEAEDFFAAMPGEERE